MNVVVDPATGMPQIVNKKVEVYSSSQSGAIVQQGGGGGGGGTGITRSVNAITGTGSAGSNSLTDYVYYWTGSIAYNYTMPSVTGNLNRYTFINRSSVSQTIIGTFNGNTNITISPNSVREFISNNTDWMVL